MSEQGPQLSPLHRGILPTPPARKPEGASLFFTVWGGEEPQPPQASRCALWGGWLSRIHEISEPKEAPPTSLQIGKLRHERGGDAPTSKFNPWSPANVSCVVSSPRSRCEGEAGPGCKPGLRLDASLHPVPAKANKTGFPALSSPNVHDRNCVQRRQMIHALIHPAERPPEHRTPSPRSPIRHGGRAQPEPRAAGPRPGGHGGGGCGSARMGGAGKQGPRGRQRVYPTSVGTPAPGAPEGRKDWSQDPAGRLPAGCRAPAWGSGGVGIHPGTPPLPTPPPNPRPGQATSRPYPRHDAQDGVRLPDQGVGVEGAPGFARSVRTPFHRACTRAVPPARRARPALARARRPAPSPPCAACTA